MPIIISEPYNYEIIEDNVGRHINVMCGSSALFEVKIPLSLSKSMELIQDKNKLNYFLKQVRDNPQKYIK
ncbi:MULTISPECIES: hypothetical protein [Enterobacter]|uniref:KTSC domain-containing protein n=1 Tax=Enterobacter cloacae TaxID=550 RepID=A0A330GB22_ENTCL|nr:MULTISPECIES: hypothetical protein [Enterobacter cloacae complex]MEC5765448.1 hypothetical protein [Enterobacter chengduensis]NBC79545.1 hypothetical protein [Enterobacter asburiae]RAZ68130.1 hypothetical protein DP202_10175 [Enterobacter cloacae]HBM9904652.1 hypothetical protein [Enterobacter chengduensis]